MMAVLAGARLHLFLLSSSRKTGASAPTLPITGTPRAAARYRARASTRSGIAQSPMRSSLYQQLALLAVALFCASSSGCLSIPDRVLEPQFHNPFPQIYRVAVLPFFN